MSTTTHLEQVAARCYGHGLVLLRAEERSHPFNLERVEFALRRHDGGQTVRIGSLGAVERLLDYLDGDVAA